MTKDEAMKMALDALINLNENRRGLCNVLAEIEALRAALAQPEKIECSRSHPHENMGSHCQLRTEIARLTNENAHLKAQPEPEPVAWMHKFIDDVITKNRPTDITRNAGRWTALYTVPPQRKPLSDDELLAALKSVDSETARLPNGFKLFARAIEAAHGIGEEK